MFKNKKILTISVMMLAVALTGCQPKKTESTEDAASQPKAVEQVEVLRLTGGAEKLALNLPTCKGNGCPEISVDRLSSNQAFIDAFVDQRILKQLDQILEIAPSFQKQQANVENLEKPSPNDQMVEAASSATAITAKQALEQQIAPYTVKFLAIDKELKALSANHTISLMIKPKILNANTPLATVVLNASSYLGGAHGASAQQYYNFDLEQKKYIQLNDILIPNQRENLQKKAHEVFKTWVIDSQLADRVEEYEQAWKFTLTDNYYLSPQGLILQYAEYEIGPYVVGLPRLTIPYDQLHTILKAQYLPKLEDKQSVAASTAVTSKAQS